MGIIRQQIQAINTGCIRNTSVRVFILLLDYYYYYRKFDIKGNFSNYNNNTTMLSLQPYMINQNRVEHATAN